MNREQLNSIVEELEHQDKAQTICCIVIAVGFWVVAAMLGYKSGYKTGRIDTYEQAVEHGFADRCADGAFEWRKGADDAQ
jgi:hypothetical protein